MHCILKGERKKFLKTCYFTSYVLICDENNFICFLENTIFRKSELCLFNYNILFKQRVILKKTKSSIEIDVIAIKKIFNKILLIEKHMYLK